MSVAGIAAVSLVIGNGIALPSGAIGSSAGHRSGASCGRIDFAPQSDNLAFDIRSYGAPCSRARSVAAGSRPSNLRPGPDRTYRADGFVCRGQWIRPEGKYYEHYVCARAAEKVIFNRG